MKLALQLMTYRSFLVVLGSLALNSTCAVEEQSPSESEGSSAGTIDRGEPRSSQPVYIVARLVRNDGHPLDGNRIFYRSADTPRAVYQELNSGAEIVLDENRDAWLFQAERYGLGSFINNFLTAVVPAGDQTCIIYDHNESTRERFANVWGVLLPTAVDGTFEMEIRVPNTAVDPERNGCVIPSEACVRDRAACTEPELFSDCQHTAVDLAWPSTTVSFTIDDMRAIESVTAINPDPVRGGYPTEMTLPVILLTLDGEHKLSAELIAETMPVEHPEYRYPPIHCSEQMYELRVPWDELPWECREYAEQGLMETEEEYRERTYDPYGDHDFAPGED